MVVTRSQYKQEVERKEKAIKRQHYWSKENQPNIKPKDKGKAPRLALATPAKNGQKNKTRL